MNNGVNQNNVNQSNNQGQVVTNTTTVAGNGMQPVNSVSNQVVNTNQVNPAVNSNGLVGSTVNNNGVVPQPQINQAVATGGGPSPKVSKPKKKRGKTIFILLLLLVIAFMGYYIYTDYLKDMRLANSECSPVSTSANETTLDINSPLVQDLYSRVATNIKEDVVSTTLDDNMKLYLAYRMIPNNLIYESNCNLFSDTAMLPYTCHVSATFVPTAFKEEVLQRQLKILFGENTNILNQNIQLGKTSCIGGYQYIEARGEYVLGYCEEVPVTTYQVTKTLRRAVSQDSIIKIYEDVDYMMSESNMLPENLKDGTYIYTFQLDKNYNYIYVGKTLDE